MFPEPEFPYELNAILNNGKSELDDLLKELRHGFANAESEKDTGHFLACVNDLWQYLGKKRRELEKVSEKTKEGRETGRQLMDEQQARLLISAEYGYNGPISDIILSRIQESEGKYNVAPLKSVMEPTKGKRLPIIKEISSINSLPNKTTIDALANPAFKDTYLITEPIHRNFKSVIFVDYATDDYDLAKRVAGFSEDSKKGHYSFKDFALVLRDHGLSPYSNAYFALVKEISMTEGCALDKDSVGNLLEEISEYSFLDSARYSEHIDFVKKYGLEYVNSLTDGCVIQPGGVVMVKKGYQQHFLDKLDKPIRKENKYPPEQFSYTPTDGSIFVDGKKYELDDSIDSKTLLDMLPYCQEERAKERLLSILPEQIPTKEAFFKLVPFLQTNHIFDERLPELMEKTGLGEKQIKGKMYKNYDSKYSEANVKVLYENNKGKILAYPAEKEEHLCELLND